MEGAGVTAHDAASRLRRWWSGGIACTDLGDIWGKGAVGSTA